MRSRENPTETDDETRFFLPLMAQYDGPRGVRAGRCGLQRLLFPSDLAEVPQEGQFPVKSICRWCDRSAVRKARRGRSTSRISAIYLDKRSRGRACTSGTPSSSDLRLFRGSSSWGPKHPLEVICRGFFSAASIRPIQLAKNSVDEKLGKIFSKPNPNH